MAEGVEPTTKTPCKSSALRPTLEVSKPLHFIDSDLLFVEVGLTGKVQEKEVRTAIRKHVRREIVPGKRKTPRKVKKLEVPEPPLGKDQSYSPFLNANTVPHSLAASIPRRLLGGGRLNPFVSYPIPMSREDLFLVDYG